jgi:hypothetical protein
MLSHTQQVRIPHKCGIRYYGYYSTVSRARRQRGHQDGVDTFKGVLIILCLAVFLSDSVLFNNVIRIKAFDLIG